MHRILTILLVAGALAASEPIRYPAEAGILDASDFGAVGDGRTDDTAAIQAALSAGIDRHQIVYLPPGTYLVSDTLRWHSGKDEGPSHGWGRFLQLRGAGREHSVIRLAPLAPGFDDPATPKAVIATGSSGYHGNKEYFHGEGNEAFTNHLRDFSIEVAAGNPGAIGIDFQASNSAGMRHVDIRAETGSGAIGIDLTRRDNGPGMLQDVAVTGFDAALRTGQEICTMVADDLRIAGQRRVGLDIGHAVVGVSRLRSDNAVPAARAHGVAHLTLVDVELTGGDPQRTAVELADGARLVLRQASAGGYAALVDRDSAPNGEVAWWTSDPPLGPQAEVALPPLLPLHYPETDYRHDLDDWALVDPPTGGDDAALVAAAFASGRAVVAFRRAVYRFGSGVVVPPHVEAIVGLGTVIDTVERRPFGPEGTCAFTFADGTAVDRTVIDGFWIDLHGGGLVAHDDARTVVLRDIATLNCRPLYANRRPSGPVVIDDVAGSTFRFEHPTRVTAWQFDLEGGAPACVVGSGVELWCLGTKAEGDTLLFDLRPGSRSEILAGFFYSFGGVTRPGIRISDAAARVSFAGTTYVRDGFYPVLVEEQRGDAIHRLEAGTVPRRGGGRSLAVYATTAP